MNVSTDEKTGRAITLDLTRQRTHLCCLDVTTYFPEHAHLFRRNELLLKNIDRALAEREIITQSFSETVKKLIDTINYSPTQNPDGVRNARVEGTEGEKCRL